MKGYLILLLGFMLAGKTSLHAQQISLQVQNRPLEEVFREIERQSGYFFTYTREQLESTLPVTLNLDKAELKAALDACLKNQPLEYEIIGKAIILKRKPNPPPISADSLPINIIPEVRGIVTDLQTQIPLAGASIQVRETLKGDYTGYNGAFMLKDVPVGSIIDISFVGYVQQSIEIESISTDLQIRLQQDSVNLGNTTVNTGLYRRPVGNFTGSSFTMTGSQLKSANPVNVFRAITALDPSIRLIENNALGNDPNTLPVIRIRGQNNLPVTTQGGGNNAISTPVSTGDIMSGYLANPNEPILILDGFQTTLQTIYDLDINRIDKVTVLKDASATVAYGSRAANGVIVVETKRPSSGKPMLTYSMNVNLQWAELAAYNLMNANELLEAQRLAGIYSDPNNQANDIALKQWYDHRLYGAQSGINTDWLAQPVKTALGMGNNLQYSGGQHKVRFSFQVNYNHLNGTLEGSSRNSFALSNYLAFTQNNFRFSNSTNFSQTRSVNSKWGPFSAYTRQFPFFRAYDDHGKPIPVLEKSNQETGIPAPAPGGIFVNPVNDAFLNSKDYSTYQLFTNSSLLEWSVIKTLRISAAFHLYSQIPESEKFLPALHSSFGNNTNNNISELGSYQLVKGKNEMFEARVSFDFNQKKGDHTFYLSGGASAQQTNSSGTGITVTGIPNDYLSQLGSANGYGANVKPTSGYNSTRSITYYASASYNYKNLYTLEATGNASGSSQFGENNRLAPFGALGAGWNLHNSGLIKPNKNITSLRLLATFGITGNQNFAAFLAQPIYQYNLQNNYRLMTGASLQGFANDDLKWQQTSKTNFALIADLFEGILNFRADYYIESTDNLILPIGVAPSTGFIAYQDNLGKTRNNGYELMLTANIIRQKQRQVNWNITLNGGHYKNTVTSLSPAIEALNEAGNSSSVDQKTPQPRFEVGQSMSRIWAVRSLGIDPATGNELFLKRDGTSSFVWDPTDKVPVGDYSSKIKGTIGSNFSYKGFTFSMLFLFEAGGQVYNQTLADKIENLDLKTSNGDKRVLTDRWKQPGDHVSFKSIYAENAGATNATSRFVQDNNYLNASVIHVGYAFPATARWVNRLKMSAPTLYITHNNAFRVGNVQMERGTAYPFARSFNIGFTTSF